MGEASVLRGMSIIVNVEKSHNKLEGDKESFPTCYDNSRLDRCGLEIPSVVRCDCAVSVPISMPVNKE